MEDTLNDIAWYGPRLGSPGGPVEMDQDVLILNRLLRVTRTPDFTEEELQYYKALGEIFSQEYPHAGPVIRGKVLTPDFTEEELNHLQWASQRQTGSCHSFCLTEEPTDDEIEGWQQSLTWLNNLDFDAAKKRVTILDRSTSETKPCDDFDDS